MKSGTRAGTALAGIILAYFALLAPALAHSSRPIPFNPSYREAIAYQLLTAAVLFATTWNLAAERIKGPAAVSSFLFFLLNPAVLFSATPYMSWTGFSALGLSLFILAWAWTRHWSNFMRPLVLSVVYALLLGCGVAGWSWTLLAFAPWILFSRRPGRAAAGTAWILLGGFSLFFVFYTIRSWPSNRFHWIARQALEHLFDGPQFATGEIGDPPAYVSIPWILLAFWVACDFIVEMVRQRRAELQSFLALLLPFLLMRWYIARGSLNWDGAADTLAAFVAASSPLVALEISRRDYLLSRASRGAAFIGFGCSVLCAFFYRRWAPATIADSWAVVPLAVGLARLFPTLRQMPLERQWRALLAGASVGCGAAFRFLR